MDICWAGHGQARVESAAWRFGKACHRGAAVLSLGGRWHQPLELAHLDQGVTVRAPRKRPEACEGVTQGLQKAQRQDICPASPDSFSS